MRGIGVGVTVGVEVRVGVAVGARVGVAVGVEVDASVGVRVGVAAGVEVKVGTAVEVLVAVAVAFGVEVAVGVRVDVAVAVGVGSRSNLAVRLLFPSIVKEHEPVPLHTPPHPPNDESPCGVWVTLTYIPLPMGISQCVWSVLQKDWVMP